eukprot:scaffold1746_cov245-Chaetoceros_neogracile.AAC.9
MDTFVQLIRNALCCVKDLSLFTSSPLHDPSYTARFYTFPAPYLSKTTPLEVLISITQLYAAISCILTGIRLIFRGGVSKLIRLNRIADVFAEIKNYKSKAAAADKKDEKSADVAARSIIATSLLHEANSALKNTFVGLCILAIGVSFFWLVANSLHITEAGWIGGLPALIHALIVAEIAMLPLLVNMIKDAGSAIKKSQKITDLHQKYAGVKSQNLVEKEKGCEKWFTFENYTMVVNTAWSPFWTVEAYSSIDEMAEEKMLVKEIEALENNVRDCIQPDYVVLKNDGAIEMECMAKSCKLEGYLEYVYFILNSIAFYGYMLGIVAFYFPDGEAQPNAVRRLKFGHSNDYADWAGNFGGDLMWTIEPIVIFASPFLIKRLSKSRDVKKVKAD